MPFRRVRNPPSSTALTVSERLFEEYLRSHGIGFEHEPLIPGSSKRPDYRLIYGESNPLVEVKEFIGAKGQLSRGAGFYDPYPIIREKINAGSRKFRSLKNYPCALLLHNVSGLLVRIDVPDIVMGAMLGDLGFKIQIEVGRGEAVGDPEPAFLGRGKMRDYKRNQPQNTTIRALLVLEDFPVGVKRCVNEMQRLQSQYGRAPTESELQPLYERAGERVLRVKYHENPYAQPDFPRELFTGPFDEHWTWEADGRSTRSFVGTGLTELEELKAS